MNTALQGLSALRNVFRPQQAPVARKGLSACDTVTSSIMDTAKQIPASVFMAELRNAGDEHICSVPELVEIGRQMQIAEKAADMYVILRELDLEWPRFAAMFPEAAADGWLALLVNRARVLRDEIDEISHANRN